MAEFADSFLDKCARAPQGILGALLDSMPYPVIMRDMGLCVVLANRAAEHFYGRDVLGSRCCDVAPFRDCVCENCPAHEALEANRAVEREVRQPEDDSHLVVGMYPVYGPEDEPCGVVEFVRDVTEDRRREHKVRSLLAELSANNRELTEWRRSFQYELNAAREIQRHLVPEGPMCVGGVCFDFHYGPSGEVGGDLFDVFPLDGRRVGVLISDASGHGVGAGLIAVMVRMVCRSYGMDREDPVGVLEAVNRELVPIIPPGQFATAFYGVCDAEEERLRMALAGHPQPLMLRGDGTEAEWLGEGGLVLGSLEEARFEEVSTEFHQGDRLVLYTDGVLDAAAPDGEHFGSDRLRELALRNRGLRGADFLNAVVEGVQDFAQRRSLSDDMTVVLLELVKDPERQKRWPA